MNGLGQRVVWSLGNKAGPALYVACREQERSRTTECKPEADKFQKVVVAGGGKAIV